ncbi:MAG: macrolide ABC transporter ATP-binding protein [Parcubacteria group bacterium]|nr:macrolide ABC transporter ATP-binding protein [Parcubacteria group bacterium]|tara:strand:- start:630 stop:1295 length:666 start_codon:yes stop_codon:yes gene_type:complete
MIKLENITKIFGQGDNETHALRGVSLFIEKGEFVAIMGPSGSGKSTMLHILGLLDSSTAGEQHLHGELVTALDEDAKAALRNKNLGFVFQSFNLLPRTNVLENVKLPLMYSDIPAKNWDTHARKVIEQVGLSHRIDHEPSQLSGGEKQRVAIARALVLQPSIIFADEPTGNLDSVTSGQIMELFDELHQAHGHTIILITHEDDIAAHAQRIIRMHDGKIVV